jgi:hypothetical protein
MVHMTTSPCINYPPLTRAFAMLSSMVFIETSFSYSGISSPYNSTTSCPALSSLLFGHIVLIIIAFVKHLISQFTIMNKIM